MTKPPFEALDFVYTPSRDVAKDLAFYEDLLGGQIVFAIEAFGTRVAEVRMAADGSRLILAGHLEGEAPVFLYRVANLDDAIETLEGRGLDIEAKFGIPHGPCASLRSPGGQRLAIYELTRPEVDEHFAGRRDFEPER
jgi:hypothetical protein